MGFILAGLVNDIVTDTVSSHVLGDVITYTQNTIFAECLTGVAACTSINLAHDGQVEIITKRLLCVPSSQEVHFRRPVRRYREQAGQVA